MTVLRHISFVFFYTTRDISVSLLYNIPKGQLSATERPYSLGISTPCGDTNDFTPHSNQPPTSGLPLLILIYTNIFNHPIPGDILAEIARRNPHVRTNSASNNVRLHNSRPSQGARNPRKGTLHNHRQFSLLDGRLCRRTSRRQQDLEEGGWERYVNPSSLGFNGS